MICTGETYKNVVKMTFAKGAALEDPSGLFNSSLEGNTRRAIDFHEGDKIDEEALKALIRAAVARNTSMRATARPVRSQKRPKSARSRQARRSSTRRLGKASQPIARPGGVRPSHPTPAAPRPRPN